MHFERLAIEAGSTTLGLELHPKLTVIAGAGAPERAGLVNELLASLGRGRPGVHTELRTAGGDHLALVRPVGERARAIDVNAATDVTHRYVDSDGQLNVLARLGLSEQDARRALRVRAEDLLTGSRTEDTVRRLAHIAQGRLWELAGAVREAEQALAEATEAAGGDLGDRDTMEEIERRHAELERAQHEYDQSRAASFAVAGTAALVAMPAAIALGPFVTVPLLLLAVSAAALSVVLWRRMEAARRREEAALEHVGADSYLGFQVRRVNGLTADQSHRQTMMRAAEAHRAARTKWELLCGQVPVDWAFEHRREIRRAAADIQHRRGAATPPTVAPSPTELTVSELSAALQRHLDDLRQREGGEPLPLLLDDPLHELSGETKGRMLETLSRCADARQIIYLTDDEEITAWARLEATTGALAVVEPTTTEAARQPTDRSGHVAA